MKKVLITGGCGFIGSHTIVDLIEKGYSVLSIDDFSNSHRQVLNAIKKITGQRVQNIEIDLKDAQATAEAFEKFGPFDGIIHFAAYKSVGESVDDPFRYYRNNIYSLINVAEAAVKRGVDRFIFSSSCTVYGDPKEIPVTEDSPLLSASSPYGLTKQVGEKILMDLASTKPGFKAVLLRYFNPAGAHRSALLGEASLRPSTNLVPIICEVASGKRQKLTVYGTDYPTRDGSCVRDYIHIEDLAKAHTGALEYLLDNKPSNQVEVFNLGIGEGITVLEATKAFERVTGLKLNYEIGTRRPGDVPAIFSHYKKAKRVLNWNPKLNIDDIMRTAWNWEQKRF
ncbi:MAG: UDP-glucose 4-epimerase GalE [Saprospirales bacterium]|nr:MAG: UDP-glucose 4-epimerase GalE [Saprospirales bacterium]